MFYEFQWDPITTVTWFQVKLLHFNDSHKDHNGVIKVGMDMHEFYNNTEWDVLGFPAYFSKRHYAGDPQPFPVWTFRLYLRRKSEFYVVNLIIPLVAHCVLTILVFYLPSDGKKISLAATTLLSLTVFFLLLQEMIPNTSLVLPMLGEYLIFTLILVTLSLVITVITMNVHFRSPAHYIMPNWIRKIFLYILPRLLRMKRPKIENSHDIELENIELNICRCTCLKGTVSKLGRTLQRRRLQRQDLYQFGSKRTRTQVELMTLAQELEEDTPHNTDLSPEVNEAISGAIFIANHLKGEDEFNRVCILPHDDVIKWQHFPRHWPLYGEFAGHRCIPLAKAGDAGLWCAWANAWSNNRDAGD